MTSTAPFNVSESIFTKVESLIPSPSQLFSLMLKENEPPLVPTPAPALISPVGFSSTLISIIFKSFDEPSDTD